MSLNLFCCQMRGVLIPFFGMMKIQTIRTISGHILILVLFRWVIIILPTQNKSLCAGMMEILPTLSSYLRSIRFI